MEKRGKVREKTWRPDVAVSALIWRGDEVLFLHRVRPPIIWVPPGGRVKAGEDPYAALQREIREETTLEQVDIVAPCIVAGGRHAGKDILFVDFTCRYVGGEISLDPREHDGWQWLELSRLAQAQVERDMAPGGELVYIYRWGEDELLCSHSLEQLRLGRRILHCLEAPDSENS